MKRDLWDGSHDAAGRVARGAVRLGGIHTARWIGLVLVVLSTAVMFGWLLQIELVVRLVPQFAVMVFNTALCFALAGAVLASSPVKGETSGLASAIGGGVVAVAGIVLAEHVLRVDLWIDWPQLHDWLPNAGGAPGRMSVPTACAFLMTGAVLILSPRFAQSSVRRMVRVLIFAVGAVGAFALFGYLFKARLLLPGYWFAGVAAHTAAGLVLLALGLRSYDAMRWPGTGFVFKREDDRITFIGACVLATVTICAGLATFTVLADRVQSLVASNILAALGRRSETVRDLVEMREVSARIAATRPRIFVNLRAIRAGRDSGEHLANIEAVVDGFLKQGFSAIAYYDADGQLVALRTF